MTDRRWPVLPTLLVALAVLTMIGLGIWQLQRAGERDAQAWVHERNSGNPALITFPELGPVPDTMLYRRASIVCLEVTGWQQSGGTARNGSRGFRFIARCRTGAEGPGAYVDMGVGTDPQARIAWTGGPVSGRITLMPGGGGMLGRLLGTAPAPSPLLVSEAAAPGLMVSAPPDPTTQGNSSWAYAGQWFFFALAAAVIYVLALQRRRPSLPAQSSSRAAGDGTVPTAVDGTTARGRSTAHDNHDDIGGSGGDDGGGGGGGGGGD